MDDGRRDDGVVFIELCYCYCYGQLSVTPLIEPISRIFQSTKRFSMLCLFSISDLTSFCASHSFTLNLISSHHGFTGKGSPLNSAD
jgi:hypothetical protein